MTRVQSLAVLFRVALFRAVSVLFLVLVLFLFHLFHVHVRVLALDHVALYRGHVDRDHAIERKTYLDN